MPRRTDTRARVVTTAAELLHSQGYHATGLNQVLAESGAPKGSLYFHFPGGKEQLAAESLAGAAATVNQAIQATLADADDPGAGVQQLAVVLADAMVASDFRKGCPIATVALEAAASSEVIRTVCAQAYDTWTDTLAGFFTGHGGSDTQSRELATTVLAALEGAQLLAKTRRDPAPLHAIGGHLRATVTRTIGREKEN